MVGMRSCEQDWKRITQELQEIVECAKTSRRGFLTTMERRQKLKSGEHRRNVGRNSFRKSWSQRTGFRRRNLCVVHEKAKEWRSRVDVNWKGSLGDRNSGRSAGVSQKKRKTVTRKEPAETQVRVLPGHGDRQELGGYRLCYERGERIDCVARTSQSQVSVCATRSAMKRASSFMMLHPFWW